MNKLKYTNNDIASAFRISFVVGLILIVVTAIKDIPHLPVFFAFTLVAFARFIYYAFFLPSSSVDHKKYAVSAFIFYIYMFFTMVGYLDTLVGIS